MLSHYTECFLNLTDIYSENQMFNSSAGAMAIAITMSFPLKHVASSAGHSIACSTHLALVIVE